MKAVLVLFVLSVSAIAAEIPQDKLSTITQEAMTFKKDCLETAKITDIQPINVFNKTSEHMDKAAFGKSLTGDLTLTEKPDSKNTLSASLASTQKDVKKTRTTNYQLTMTLRGDGGKELCKKTYSKEFTETLK